jgi:hypothetical protein
MNGEKMIDGKMNEILKRLEKIEDDLERIKEQTFHPAMPVFPTKLGTKCSVCGIEWSGVMGYVCTNKTCPMQVKVTFSS